MKITAKFVGYDYSVKFGSTKSQKLLEINY